MPVDKGDDNSPREAVELALSAESDKARERRIVEAWDITLSTPQGRAVMWAIIQRTGKDEETPFGTTDQVMRHIGRHGFGTELYLMIKANYPKRFLEMIRENM